MKNSWIIIIAALALLMAIIGLYFFRFNDGLSYTQNDWAAFGGYIGGIAAVANVVVFIWLTIAIKNAGDAQRIKELEHQKRMVLMQMRQQGLYRITSVLESVTVNLAGEELSRAIVLARKTLSELHMSGGGLFRKENYKLTDKDELLNEIEEYCYNKRNFEDIICAYVNFNAMSSNLRFKLQNIILRE